MSRYPRNTVILAKIETVIGTDAVPTGAANAIQISNQSINPLNAQNVDRALLRGFFGGSEQLVGTSYIEVGFDVEIAGSGAAGTVPAWGALLQGCAFAEAITVATRVDYTPVSTALKTMTIYYYDDGALHKLLGAMGDVSFNLGLGEKPTMSFRFIGLDGGITAAANATPTLTAFQKPLVLTDANTGDVTIGCTYAAGALVAGTAYKSKGMQVAMGNKLTHVPLLGGDSVDIPDRDATGSIELDLTASEEVTLMAVVKANTTQGIGMLHGTAAGNKVLLFCAAAQMLNPKKAEYNGRRLIGYDLRNTPSAGNDEVRIVAL